jgi:hypothetical protein
MIPFDAIAETGFIVGMILGAIYGTLALCYYVYRYAKGDNHPSISDCELHRKDVLKLLNPFYYKHPMNIMVTTMFFLGGIGGLAMVWPVLIPAGVTYYAVNKIREKNLHKKKMWNELKGS